MNNSKIFTTILKIFQCTAFITVIVIFIYCIYVTPNIRINLPSKLTFFNEGWTMEDQQIAPLPFTYYAKKSKMFLSFYNTLPTNISSDDILMFKSKHCETHIYIDGIHVYSYGEQKSLPFGTMAGDICCFVPIKEEYRGKNIEVRIVLNSSKAICFDRIVIGTKESVLRYVLHNNFWYVLDIFILTLVFLGVITVLLFNIYAHVKINYSFAAYYIVLVAELAVLLYFHSNLFQFQSTKTTTGCLIAQISILLVQCTIVGLCKNILQKRSFAILEFISFLLILIMTVLYVTNIMNPIDFVTPIMIYSPIVVIYALVASFKKRKTNALATYMFFDLIILTLSIIIGQTFFYYKNRDNLGVATFANGIILFSLGILLIVEKNIVDSSNEVVKTKIYKKIAYIDSMTGLENRLGFDKKLREIQASSDVGTPLTLIICDLNYLKQANDIYGHSAGDKLIIDAANCLKNSVTGESFCYRLGGDEFGIIVIGSKESGEQIVQNIHSQIDLHNSLGNNSLSLAIGYAFSQIKNNESDYTELYHNADQDMYINKRSMHAERHV